MAPGHGACLKGMSRAITLQCFTLAAITTAKKHILIQDSTRDFGKVNGALNACQCQWAMVYLNIMSKQLHVLCKLSY